MVDEGPTELKADQNNIEKKVLTSCSWNIMKETNSRTLKDVSVVNKHMDLCREY